MKTANVNIHGRVRKNTPDKQNRKIDQKMLDHILKYKKCSASEITFRLAELKKEWDIEKTLEVNASSFALFGILMGVVVNKKWLALPGVVAGFLLQHGVQGWCPPLTLLRAMGVRTRQEINEEIYILKILRGDFENVNSETPVAEIFHSLRKI